MRIVVKTKEEWNHTTSDSLVKGEKIILYQKTKWYNDEGKKEKMKLKTPNHIIIKRYDEDGKLHNKGKKSAYVKKEIKEGVKRVIDKRDYLHGMRLYYEKKE